MIHKLFAKSAAFTFIFSTILFFSGCFGELPETQEKLPQKPTPPPDTTTRSEFDSGILDRGAVIQSAKNVTPKEYPNSDDVLVNDYIFNRYNNDGTSVTWDDTFIKVLTEKGRRDHQSLSFYYTLPYSTVVLKVVEIIKPDGQVIPVDIKNNCKVMVNNSQMGANIYNPNSKVMMINVPGLQIGDMIRYVSFRNVVKTRVPNTWSDYFLLEYTSPIKNMTIEIVGPKSLPLRSIAIKDEIKGTVKPFIKDDIDFVRYKWEVSNVPRMFQEPNMPPMHSVVQRLLVSTIREWSYVSEWYWKLCKPHLDIVTPEMRSKVQELTMGAAGNRKKIEAIFYFVSQKIRYMGITTEKESPGYEPHDVKTTFENKYGVCRDKAALLVAMLRIAGFKAYPVLIMNGPKKDPDVPNPYFNHAIACVEMSPGKYILMDPTDENTKELFPAYLCNQSYLVAKPQGDDLQVSSIIPATSNLMNINTNASINDAGIMIAETSMRFNGINDGAYRGYFANRKPIERKRFFERIIKKVLPGAKLVEYDIQPENIQDTSQALKVYLRYIAENTFIKGDGKLMLPPPSIGSSVGVVNFILGKTGLEKRKYPLVTDIACGVRETFSIDLKNAVGGNIALPQSKPMGNDTLLWDQNLQFKNNILSGKNDFMLKVVEFTPEQYLSLKESLKKIEYNKRKTPIFYEIGISKVSDNFAGRNGNVIILDETFDCKVLDSSSWITTRTVKKKILTYAGKKQNSELKIKYNPAWEQVTLKYAKVFQKDGKEKNISTDEINLMDQPWVGASPRYPPGKILVVSLPGVDVDAVIEYQIVRKYKNRPFFSLIEYMQGFDPILKKKFILTIPEKFPLKISNINAKGVNAFTFKNEGKGVYSWNATDVEALKFERDLPPFWAFVPSAALSSGDWFNYENVLSEIFLKAASMQNAAELQAKKITKGAMNQNDEIIAVRDFVAKNIKDVGPDLGELPLESITPADKTLADGYGNSADRAILIYAMLKSLNFKPEFVLVSNMPKINELNRFDLMPEEDLFKSVLVKVTVNKNPVYLNDTDQYSQLGTTPSEGKISLPLNTGLVSKIDLANKLLDRTDIAYTIRLAENGKAVITRKSSFYGSDYSYWNKKYTEMTEEERKRHFQEIVASISQSAIPKGSLKTDFNKYPGTEELSVEVSNFAVAEKDYLYLKLPGTMSQVLGLHSDVRENPFMLQQSNRTTRTYLLNLPKSFASKIPIAPISDVWKLPANAGLISIVNDRDFFKSSPKPVLFINQDINLQPAVIRQDQFDELQFVAEKISSPKTQTVLMEKAK